MFLFNVFFKKNLNFNIHRTYGIVMKCRHKQSGLIVAIKKFKRPETHDRTSTREVRILKVFFWPFSFFSIIQISSLTSPLLENATWKYCYSYWNFQTKWKAIYGLKKLFFFFKDEGKLFHFLPGVRIRRLHST